jgi:3-hydroxyisobutyrate dehydrogenase-like beta-hydroxyacid dehydrogenase
MQRTSVALIGYGEVGHIFARDLLAGGRADVCAYDIIFDDGSRGAALIEEVRAAGVRPVASVAEAATAAHLIISAVTASSSFDVAAKAAGFVRAGQVFLDINSVSPQVKQTSAQAIEAMGADYIEAAVMAPVAIPGLGVPILLGGRTAADAAPLLTALGMNVRVVADAVGRASATKLCRSIIIKGLEALMIDCAEAARHFGVEDDVFSSLQDTFPATDFARLAQTMAARVRRHGVRRAAEMREAATMLEEMGRDPSLVMSVAEAQARHAEKAE